VTLTLRQTKAFAERLDHHMRHRKPRLNNTVLASLVGCSAESISALRRGQANPSRLMLTRLAHELRIQDTDLVPAELHGELMNRVRPFGGQPPSPPAAQPTEPTTLPEPPAEPVHSPEANRLDAELTYRRLAARLTAALAVAEDTIEALRPRKGRLPEWGGELLAVGDELRNAGVTAVDLHEAAAELGGGR
jgi:transcriptional regulator with XRE-family HTH domain